MSSSRDPMWYCHECNAEMRPLMIPDPHCASCHGTFVEMMDDPADDPRQHAITGGISFLDEHDSSRRDDDHAEPPAGGMGSVLDLLSTMLRPAADQTHPQGGRMRIVINSPTGTRTVQFGGPNTLGGSAAGNPGGVQRLSDFISSTTGSPSTGNDGSQTRRAPAPLLASYILSTLLNGGHGRGTQVVGIGDPFEMLAGGRYGDYIVNEQALENIMNELMATGAGQAADPPAPEDVIDDLPRVVLEDGHPLLNDSCSICHEPFNPALAASADADADSAPSSSDTKEAEDPSQTLVGVTLPCDHTFHEGCILPWLRMKSTCPVCRKTVLPNASDSSAQGSSTATAPQQQTGSHQRPSNSHDDDAPHIPGAWDGLE